MMLNERKKKYRQAPGRESRICFGQNERREERLDFGKKRFL